MNKINQINSRPAFGSLIHISNKAYKAAPLSNLYMKGKCIDFPWTIFDSKYLKEGFTLDASYCTIGVIKNNDGDAFMFHLRPSQDINTAYLHLAIAASNLKRRNKKLTGILAGGNTTYKPSVKMYENLQKIFNSLKIDYSALLGQRNKSKKYLYAPTTNVYYNGEHDKYILSLVNRRNIDIKSMQSLKKYFDIVKIRKDDNIKFD